jgi:hypothetical protein
MSQILRIFKKDTRHLWPEILISVLLTAAMIRIYPVTWSPQRFSASGLDVAVPILVALVPLSWWILITRLIQAESLVGDRQFWLTRPYEWTQLLTAKIVFLIAFLYLPIFAAHCLLLIEADFHPFSYMPGLFYNLVLLTGFIVLPLFSLATVTSNFVKLTLTVLAVLLSFVGMIVLASTFPHSQANIPGDSHLSFVFFVTILLAVIVLQYAIRRHLISRAILVGVALLIVLSSVTSSDAFFVRRAYPQPASGSTAMQLSYPADASFGTPTYENFGRKEKQVSLSIPLKVVGVAAGRAVIPENVSVSIEAPNGLHWTSPWQRASGEKILPSTSVTRVNIAVDRIFIEQVWSMPLTVHLILTIGELQSGPSVQIPITRGDFAVPGIGICSLPDQDRKFDIGNEKYFSSTVLNCRSAVRQPRLTYLQANWSKTICSDPSSAIFDDDTFGDAWIGSQDSAPAELSLAPIWTSFISLSNRRVVPGEQTSIRPHEIWHLCPGTPLTLTPYSVIGRTQIEFTVHDLRLPPFQRLQSLLK